MRPTLVPLGSPATRFQVLPLSFDWYTPLFASIPIAVPTPANSTALPPLTLLVVGSMTRSDQVLFVALMDTVPANTLPGKVILFHVLPPSVDFQIPALPPARG